MAAIMLMTGLVFEVPGTRQQILSALAATGGTATGPVNGVQTTVYSAAVIAVSDSIEGLRATLVMAVQPDPPVEVT